MSYNTYAVQITGCVIKEDLIDQFIEKYIEHNPNEFLGIDDPKDEVESLLSCNEKLTCSSSKYADDVFSAQLFCQDDTYYDTATLYSLSDINGWNEDIRMPFIVVNADKTLLSREVFKGNYYASKEELINEMKKKVEKYLPENFDYEGNIGDIEYALSI